MTAIGWVMVTVNSLAKMARSDAGYCAAGYVAVTPKDVVISVGCER